VKELFGIQSTVLFVDDDKILTEIVQEDLAPFFGDIIVAHDGEEAIQILKRKSVQVVVTDFMMPKMNGVQLIKWMKVNLPMVPVIMLTDQTQEHEVNELLKSGLFDVVPKPFKVEVIVNRIQNCLLLPKLLKVLWAVMSNEMEVPQVESFLKMSFENQMKALNAYWYVLESRGILNSKENKRVGA
jgi:DNA-binding NtrC family response regulator